MPGQPTVSGERLLAAEQRIAQLLTSGRTAESPVAVMSELATLLGWRAGFGWRSSRSGARLRCLVAWPDGDAVAAPFVADRAARRLRRGEQLPGQVAQVAEARWTARLDEAYPEHTVAVLTALGVRSAGAFPIIGTSGSLGAVEFFSTDADPPDPRVEGFLGAIGRLLGVWTEAAAARFDVSTREARHSAILASALEGVVTIDADGRVVEFNPAAEEMFGHLSEDAVGRELADLLVPPAQRAAHRAGLRRYLDTGEAALLGRRAEVLALRADGSEFPVELTITRLPVPGPPLFTGHLRDITERQRAAAERARAAAELRASRARVVEAADDERRRIQRDLHDGAQQRLIALAMLLGRIRDGAPDGLPAATAQLLADARAQLDAAIRELRDLARGVHPDVLSDLGLAAAVRELLRRCPLECTLQVELAGRPPQEVEVAAYFVIAEAVTNATKYAPSGRVEIGIAVDADDLVVHVSDDGPGGADAAAGSGLRGLEDRVAALGGALGVRSPAGGGTRLEARLPLAPVGTRA